MDYSQHVATATTPQSKPLFGREAEMAANSAGGYTFTLDKWQQLERFLVLGTEGGTYYATEPELTRENANVLLACIREDGLRTVDTIARMRYENRAPKINTLIFALAMCAKMGQQDTPRQANATVPEICQTATQLFMFLKYVKALGGKNMSAGTRRAVRKWYASKTPEQLAYQVVKYRSREGWTHRDALRIAHPKPQTDEYARLFKWITKGPVPEGTTLPLDLAILDAYAEAQQATQPSGVIPLIQEHNLPWECVPTALMKSPEVNEALLQKMPMMAMTRQLGRMSAVGLLKPMSDSAQLVIQRLSNGATVRESRIHPIQMLAALVTYGQGHGARGSLTWDVNQQIVDALDWAFYAAFDNVKPTGKRFYLGLDCSGSMGCGDIAGIPGLKPSMAAAAMAMVTARVEPQYTTWAFSGQMKDVGITDRDRLDTTMRKIYCNTFGRTDCALPMLHAIDKDIEVDTFLIYTDSETWYGGIHPCAALQKYRKAFGIPAKLVVVGMTSTGFTIADPKDAGMIDVVGFDSAAPQIISDFAMA